MNSFILFLLLGLFSGSSCDSEQSSSEYLDQMSQILNNAIPSYKEVYNSKGFYLENGIPKNFFVYNLVDTTINSYPAKTSIQIGKEGVFHFSPVRYEISFSHIAVIKNGEMKVFGFLNCEGKGDDIDQVINYVSELFDYDEMVLNRIRNYRKYGMYFQMDPQSYVRCE